MTEVRGSSSYGLEWVALDKHVLLVRVTSGDEENGVYVGAAEGKDYAKDALGVITNGSAVSHMLAAVYFKPPWTWGKPVKWLFQAKPFHDEKWVDKKLKLVKPEGIERPPEWGPNLLDVHPLDRHVLAVAASLPNLPGDTWAAYVGAVEGNDFDKEAGNVVVNGSEIPFEVAEVLFQDLGKSTRAGYMRWVRDPQPRPMERDPDMVSRIRAGVRRQKDKGQSWPQPSTDEDHASTR